MSGEVVFETVEGWICQVVEEGVLVLDGGEGLVENTVELLTAGDGAGRNAVGGETHLSQDKYDS